MKKLIETYQNLVIYRMGFMCLLWAPIPVAVIKLQGTLLTPTMITIIMAAPCVLGISRRWMNSKFTVMSAAYVSFWTNILYIVIIGLAPTFGVSQAWMLVLSPLVGCITGMFESIGESKACNTFKAYIELDDFYARDTKVQSICMLIGQGLAFIFYTTVTDIDLFTVWYWLIIICNVAYLLIDIQRIYLLKAMFVSLDNEVLVQE